MSTETQTDHLKKLLRPDVVIELEAMVSGPLDLLQLKDRLERSHLSQNGESTSEPTVERLIKFKAETWEALNRLAEQLEAQGTCVTPAEVAKLLVESTIDRI